MNNNKNKMANFDFLKIAHTSFISFHFILTSGPIFIANNHQEVIFSRWMLLRQVLGVCSIRIPTMIIKYTLL